MTGARSPRVGAPAPGIELGKALPVGVVVLGLGLSTALAVNLSDASPLLGAVPVLVAVALWLASVVPLRWSATTLLFLSLALDDRSSAEGRWRTPLSILGDFLHFNIDSTFRGASGLKVTGTELLTLILIVVAVARRSKGDRTDTAGRVPMPRVMRDFALVLAVALGYAVANGLASGGNAQIALWQARPFLDILALLLLFQLAYRGPSDNPLVGRAIVAAAVVKALLAVWVRYRVAPHFAKMEYTTTHGDSMLFVTACAILAAHVLERRTRKSWVEATVLLPLLAFGIHANGRRLAWVELAFVAILFFRVTRPLPWKRKLLRAALVGLPVVALYVAAGWESSAPFFGPVTTLRSVVDVKHDRSTWDRHVESWNIATSLRGDPLRGRGFGHEYTEYMLMDDISSVFPMYKAVPHNFLLGLLLFAGPIAFAGLVAIFGATIFLAARTYAYATAPIDRAGALVYMAIMLVVWVQTHGDMGILSPQAPLLSALAMALAGKAAVATGAYPSGSAPAPLAARAHAVPDRRRLAPGPGTPDATA